MYSFPNLNQFIVPCPVLTVASLLVYRFLRRKVKWPCLHLVKDIPQFVVIHTVKGFSIVNEADVFVDFPCFPYDPTDVGNSISGFSDISKSSLNICKFSVHVLLKCSLKDFEYYLASMQNEYDCVIV